MANFSPNSSKALGSALEDGVRFGKIHKNQYLIDTFGNTTVNGGTVSANGLSAATGATGIFGTPITSYFINPVTNDVAGISAAATAAGAGYVTLVGAVTIPPLNTTTGVILDCERNVTVSGAANSTTVNATIYGLDMYGVPVGETFATTAGTNTTSSAKTYKVVTGVYFSAGTTANVSVGWGNAFGLPYYLPAETTAAAPTSANTRFDLILQSTWANVGQVAAAYVGGDPRTATAATGNVRGKFTSSVSAPDGIRGFTIHYMLAAAVPPQSSALLKSTASNPISYFGMSQYIPARL